VEKRVHITLTSSCEELFFAYNVTKLIFVQFKYFEVFKEILKEVFLISILCLAARICRQIMHRSDMYFESLMIL
jgi:hypothetical protein